MRRIPKKELTRALAEIRDMVRGPATMRPPPPHPVDWAEKVSGKKLDEWQAEVMLWDGQDALLNCTRQCGKTEVVSLRAAYRAKFADRSVGCLGPTSRQTSRLHRRAKRWLQNDGTDFIRNVGLELELPYGGQIQAFPGDRPDVSIRGDTLDDVIVDEASVIKDELIAAATPTTATRADRCIIYLSTPKGQRGAFYKAWNDEPWWTKFTVTADQCPRISKKFLEKEKKRLGALFEQEYFCKFLATPGALFSAEDISALFSGMEIPEFMRPAEVEKPGIW